MKNFIFFLATFFVLSFFTSCATICGGARYNATVVVPDHPLAKITVNGEYKGEGVATFKHARRDASDLRITIEEDNCEPETTYFKSRKFRGWAFVGTLIVDQIEGIIIDASTGAWWKPDIKEPGVTKIDYDNYRYTIPYKAIPRNNSDKKSSNISNPNEALNSKNKTIPDSKAAKLRELKKLLDEGILTQEEFEKEKKKVLDE